MQVPCQNGRIFQRIRVGPVFIRVYDNAIACDLYNSSVIFGNKQTPEF